MTEKKFEKQILTIAKAARQAAPHLKTLTSKKKNQILKDLAAVLKKETAKILKANAKDVKKAHEKKLNAALIDRLVLNEKRIVDMCQALKSLTKLSDPVGEKIDQYKHGDLTIQKVRIPLGVIAMIYESRPNVTVDAASLCLKSGNAIVLRGGSEAFESNKALVKIIQSVLQKYGLPKAAVSFVPHTDRKAMVSLMQLSDCVDVLIPRGGENLMKFVNEHSKIPVIKHDKGVCGLFVDSSAKIEKALGVIVNAKTDRPGVCNALESLYIHKAVAKKLIPKLFPLLEAYGVEIRADANVKKIYPDVKKAAASDFSTEYLDLVLSVMIVKNVDEAIAEIQKHSSRHTDGILSESPKNIQKFLNALDSSCLMINTSTRFHDGGELGLGAEIGISTTKLHAYGAMGLRELTTSQYVVKSRYKMRGKPT